MAEYPDFVGKCGYGSVTGIGGANCRCTAQLLAIYRGSLRADVHRLGTGGHEAGEPAQNQV